MLTAMRQWGDKRAAPDGPPVEMIHANCGNVTEAVMVCSSCGEPFGTGDIRAAPGPGYTEGLLPAEGSRHRTG